MTHIVARVALYRAVADDAVDRFHARLRSEHEAVLVTEEHAVRSALVQQYHYIVLWLRTAKEIAAWIHIWSTTRLALSGVALPCVILIGPASFEAQPPPDWIVIDAPDQPLLTASIDEFIERILFIIDPYKHPAADDLHSEQPDSRPRDPLTKRRRPVHVFISYAQRDEPYREELERHLAPLERQGLVKIWYGGQAEPGVDRDAESKRRISVASVTLMMISADYLASSACFREMSQAQQVHERSQARVVPILLRPCDYHLEWFAGIMPLPANRVPVVGWRSRDEAWTLITRAVRRIVEDISEDSVPIVELPTALRAASGALIASRYSVRELLGRGERCEVWSAWDRSTGDNVVLKRLYEFPTRETIHRIRRESRAVASIESPHVPRLISVIEATNGNILVFERLYGMPLSVHLATSRFLTLPHLGPVIRGALLGLQATHSAGIVHRNIQPSNVFICAPEGRAVIDAACRAVLIGFGTVQFLRRAKDASTVTALTSPHQHLGIPDFAAPEQWGDSTNASERSDIYSIGLVAFQGLTGVLPRHLGTPLAHINGRSTDMTRLAPVLSKSAGSHWSNELANFFMRTLRFDPEHRFATAVEALEAWREACAKTAHRPRT